MNKVLVCISWVFQPRVFFYPLCPIFLSLHLTPFWVKQTKVTCPYFNRSQLRKVYHLLLNHFRCRKPGIMPGDNQVLLIHSLSLSCQIRHSAHFFSSPASSRRVIKIHIRNRDKRLNKANVEFWRHAVDKRPFSCGTPDRTREDKERKVPQCYFICFAFPFPTCHYNAKAPLALFFFDLPRHFPSFSFQSLLSILGVDWIFLYTFFL